MSKRDILGELAFLTGNDAYALHKYAAALKGNPLEVLREMGEQLERIASRIDHRAERIEEALKDLN